MFNLQNKFALHSPVGDDDMTVTADPIGPTGPSDNAGGNDGNGSGRTGGETVSASELTAIYSNLVRFEDDIPYLYVDSTGHITIGIGTMIPNLDRAYSLGLRKANGELATQAEISAEFSRLQELARQNNNNLRATAYQAATSLYLNEQERKGLLAEHVQNDRGNLRNLFDNFESIPFAGQIALHNMMYNLGYGDFRGYNNFREAIRTRAYDVAARESRISTADDKRNAYLHDTFQQLFNDDFANGNQRNPGDGGN